MKAAVPVGVPERTGMAFVEVSMARLEVMEIAIDGDSWMTPGYP
jgi:hypothetical protein